MLRLHVGRWEHEEGYGYKCSIKLVELEDEAWALVLPLAEALSATTPTAGISKLEEQGLSSVRACVVSEELLNSPSGGKIIR